jgi:hypothetical protein
VLGCGGLGEVCASGLREVASDVGELRDLGRRQPLGGEHSGDAVQDVRVGDDVGASG